LNKTLSKWSHLPNASHIDSILASVQSHPDQWAAAWDAVRGAAYDAAWSAAWLAARVAAYDAALVLAASSAAWDEAFDAAWSAILALVAYDHCAQYLDMTSDQLRVWAALSENPAPVLLIPATIAREKIKELALV